MVGGACRTSGSLSADALVYSGRVKLISVHATNMHLTEDALLIIYDNTAASGTTVLTLILEPKKSIEVDMHGAICETGLYAAFSVGPAGAAGVPNCTVQFA